MTNQARLFKTNNYAVSYTSDVVHTPSKGYRTGVVQVDAGNTDTVIIQGRVGGDMPWVDVLTVQDEGTLTELVLAPQLRAVVTNNSASPVLIRVTE